MSDNNMLLRNKMRNSVGVIEEHLDDFKTNLARMAVNDVAGPLRDDDWTLLARCEKALYAGEFGAHAWTEVNVNDGSRLLYELWSHTLESVDNALDPDITDNSQLRAETARRVAAALAIMAFGKEFLLK